MLHMLEFSRQLKEKKNFLNFFHCRISSCRKLIEQHLSSLLFLYVKPQVDNIAMDNKFLYYHNVIFSTIQGASDSNNQFKKIKNLH